MTHNELLLGRAEVRAHPPTLLSPLVGKRIAVTGAAGTIGSEIVRTLLNGAHNPLDIMAMDRNEQAVAESKWGSLGFSGVGCVASDEGARALTMFGPDIVFHAAAYKHVPLMEGHARAALLNNVIGTANASNGPWRTVLISTDKAVNPSCVMGATKRMAEEVVLDRGGVVVRLVNVIGSSGSVVDTWRKGGLTVLRVSADAGVSRWWMTAGEAADAAICAATACNAGQTCLPVNRTEIAVWELYQRFKTHERPDVSQIPVGLRPGEKAREDLYEPGERCPERNNGTVEFVPEREYRAGRALAVARDILASDATDTEAAAAMMSGGWLRGPEGSVFSADGRVVVDDLLARTSDGTMPQHDMEADAA